MLLAVCSSKQFGKFRSAFDLQRQLFKPMRFVFVLFAWLASMILSACGESDWSVVQPREYAVKVNEVRLADGSAATDCTTPKDIKIRFKKIDKSGEPEDGWADFWVIWSTPATTVTVCGHKRCSNGSFSYGFIEDCQVPVLELTLCRDPDDRKNRRIGRIDGVKEPPSSDGFYREQPVENGGPLFCKPGANIDFDLIED